MRFKYLDWKLFLSKRGCKFSNLLMAPKNKSRTISTKKKSKECCGKVGKSPRLVQPQKLNLSCFSCSYLWMTFSRIIHLICVGQSGFVDALELGKLFRALFCRADSERLLLVVVEVARVSGSLAARRERWLHLLLVDCNPVNWSKPLVVLDVIDTIAQVSIPFGQVNLHKKIVYLIKEITISVKNYQAEFKCLLPARDSSGGPWAQNWSGRGIAPCPRRSSRRSGWAGRQRMEGILQPFHTQEHPAPTSRQPYCSPCWEWSQAQGTRECRTGSKSFPLLVLQNQNQSPRNTKKSLTEKFSLP